MQEWKRKKWYPKMLRRSGSLGLDPLYLASSTGVQILWEHKTDTVFCLYTAVCLGTKPENFPRELTSRDIVNSIIVCRLKIFQGQGISDTYRFHGTRWRRKVKDNGCQYDGHSNSQARRLQSAQLFIIGRSIFWVLALLLLLSGRLLRLVDTSFGPCT